MILAGLERYEKSKNAPKRVKRELTLDERIERAEIACGSALGIMKANPDGYTGREYRSKLLALRQLMGKKLGISDYWSIPTAYDLPKVETPEIPAGMAEGKTSVSKNGMLVFEWTDLAQALHAYDTSTPDWDIEWRKADQKVLDWLNERPYEVHVWNYDRPWNMDESLPSEYDVQMAKAVAGVRYWVRYYTS